MKRFIPDGRVLREFMADRDSRVKIIQGPVGSGTSSACCLHIYQQAMEQALQSDGKQRFRAYVLRDNYPMLEKTTVQTWLHWFPEDEFGRFYQSKPFRHEIRVGPLELDVHFVAMEDVYNAIAFFKSLEPSLIWFNEGQFTNMKIIQSAVERVSPPRYPAMMDGGCSWGGMLIDTNAPPADHWIPIMRGDVPPPDWMSDDEKQMLKKPPGWTFYLQPPGLLEVTDNKGEIIRYEPNPEAENTAFLPPNFYLEKLGGQSKDWIDANIMNQSAVVIDGKPVYPRFRRDLHVSDEPLEVISGIPVMVGIDFGRTPAAIICQRLRSRWFIQREIIGRDMGADQFAPILKAELQTWYPGQTVLLYGDPSGGFKGQASDRTAFDIFRMHGMKVLPAPDYHRYQLRWEAVNSILGRDNDDKPRLVVDPRMTTFITGMAGGYHLRRKQVKLIAGEIHKDEPEKNQYSHPVEAFEAAVLGAGEGRSITLPGSDKSKPKQTRKKYNPFGSREGVRW